MKPVSTPPVPTDIELLVLARTGDQQAYGQIVSRHQTLIASLAYSICGDFGRSQDIAQEAFISAWRQLEALEDDTKFKAWLCGITRNLGHNLLRKQTRRADQPAELFDALPEPAAGSPSPDEQAVTQEESAIVWQALERLPEIYREPLILFYREHQSVERVAAGLDLTAEAVKQRLSRGRNLVREQVEKLVERSLGRTTPGIIFTTAVISALPALTTQVVAASTASTIVKAGLAKAALSLSWLPLLGAPLLAYLGGRQQLRYVNPPADRAFLKRFNGVNVLGIFLANLCAVAGVWALRRQLRPGKLTSVTNLMLGAEIFLLSAIVVYALWNLPRLLEISRRMQLPENAPAWRKRLWFGPNRAVAYRSRMTAFGLPLIDIRFGRSPEAPTLRATARGWIALGDIAHGVLFALGGIAIGGVAVGGLAFGGLAIGGASLGLMAVGGLALGGLANGFFAFGYLAMGGLLGVGIEGAEGIVALSRHFAHGLFVTSTTQTRIAGRQWTMNHPIMRAWASAAPDGLTSALLQGFLRGISIALCSMLATSFLLRRHDDSTGKPGLWRRLGSCFRSSPAFLVLFAFSFGEVVLLSMAAVQWSSRHFAEIHDEAIAHARKTVALTSDDQALLPARYDLGREFSQADRPAEALTEFLWCFDHGMRNDRSASRTRERNLLTDLQLLAETYPPARAGLQERRDRAQALVLAGAAAAKGTSLQDVIDLDQVLDDETRSVTLYDRLPPSSPARVALGRQLFPAFLAAKRYQDAAQAQPLPLVLNLLSANQRYESRHSGDSSAAAVMHDFNVTHLAERIEALAGAGQSHDAGILLTAALAYDHSDDARATYREKLQRAGHAELLP